MSTFQVVVCKDGHQLFRTEEQDCGVDNKQRETVGAALAQAFPGSEGYNVDMVIWPDKRGQLIDITVG